jgi:hypothetical protein
MWPFFLCKNVLYVHTSKILIVKGSLFTNKEHSVDLKRGDSQERILKVCLLDNVEK